MIGQLLDHLGEWTRDVMMTLGYPGLVLIMIIENVFPPIPSEVVLPLAGFLAQSGSAGFTLPLVILAGGLGSVLGALVLYGFGAWAREHGGRVVVVRALRYAFISDADLTKAEDWFARYQGIAVFTGRFVPLVRSLVSIPAGYNGMPMAQFLALTAIGTTTWCAVLASAGWVLGANWALVRQVLSTYEKAVLAAIVLVVLAFLTVRLRRRFAPGRG